MKHLYIPRSKFYLIVIMCLRLCEMRIKAMHDYVFMH